MLIVSMIVSLLPFMLVLVVGGDCESCVDVGYVVDVGVVVDILIYITVAGVYVVVVVVCLFIVIVVVDGTRIHVDIVDVVCRCCYYKYRRCWRYQLCCWCR